ncbi:MAG TPA: hypothetical protein VF850_07610 [Gemmatimonadaceae bacterium]
MIRSTTNAEPFNGSDDMVAVKAAFDESATAGFEVILTTRATNGSVSSTTIVVPPAGGLAGLEDPPVPF